MEKNAEAEDIIQGTIVRLAKGYDVVEDALEAIKAAKSEVATVRDAFAKMKGYAEVLAMYDEEGAEGEEGEEDEEGEDDEEDEDDEDDEFNRILESTRATNARVNAYFSTPVKGGK